MKCRVCGSSTGWRVGAYGARFIEVGAFVVSRCRGGRHDDGTLHPDPCSLELVMRAGQRRTGGEDIVHQKHRAVGDSWMREQDHFRGTARAGPASLTLLCCPRPRRPGADPQEPGAGGGRRQQGPSLDPGQQHIHRSVSTVGSCEAGRGDRDEQNATIETIYCQPEGPCQGWPQNPCQGHSLTVLERQNGG